MSPALSVVASATVLEGAAYSWGRWGARVTRTRLELRLAGAGWYAGVAVCVLLFVNTVARGF